MSLSDADFAVIQELMRTRTGQTLEPHRRTMCVLKLGQLAQANNIGSISELVRRLGSDALLQRQAVESILNGETSFFRDPHAFRTLATAAIPALLEARPGITSLKIWCAACSSGQEPYSVAMQLADLPLVQRLGVDILATDYSLASLERAKAGRYSQLEVNRGLPTKMLARYFTQSAREWTVKPELRACVRFEHVDLAFGELPSGTWDLILLRNVLIYFALETKQRILKRILPKLAPGGFILFGGSETALGINDELVPASFGHGFFQQRDRR